MVTNSFWHRLVVTHRGKSDGRKNDPPAKSEHPSQFERSLIDRANRHILEVHKQARERDEKLQGRQDDLLHRLGDVEDDYHKTRDRYEAKKVALARDVVVPFPKTAYYIFMAFLVLGEFPFNAVVFRVFEEAAWLTIVMATTLALAIPFIAHFIGIWVRRWPRPWWWTGLKVLAATLVVVFGLLALNYVRSLYLESEAGELTRVAGREGLEYAYFAINFLVFAVAGIASYFAHDEDEEIEELRRRTVALAARRATIVSKLRGVEAARDSLLCKSKGEVDIVKAVMQELIHHYRRANAHKRREPAPSCFNDEPRFAEPEWWEEQTSAGKRSSPVESSRTLAAS